jgi:hypothetical protein
MSEVGIATAAPEKMVLAVISHLNKGEIDDALALFADQFSFKDHGIGLEFNEKDRLAEFFRKARELYPDTLVRTETIFVSVYRMDGSSNVDRTTFRQLETKGSNLAARSFRGSHRKRQDHKLVRLLRRSHFPAHGVGVIFHRVGRILKF